MKSNEETQYVEKIGQSTEQSFQIKASAASFQILSSGLYSNKIRAICRELFCNAADSHKAAGTFDIPFEVTLPNFMNPHFVIKDFGTGLTHEEVMTIYTTYFHSTKNDSNEYIGQLGLGSKSPFSYTNQFVVESRKDGISRSYSMFINESGVPAVSLIGEIETSENNGLTLTIAVKSNDFYKFIEETQNTLMYFDPYPIVNGDHKRKEFDYLIKKEKWAIRNELTGYKNTSECFIVQGFVRYPIDTSQLFNYHSDNVELTESGSAILNSPIDFFVPIGLVQVAPSREHLSYDKKTIENLIEFINSVAEELTDSLATMIENAQSLWDARVLAGTFMNYDSIYRRLYENLVDKKIALNYNGKAISPYGFDLSELDSIGDMVINTHKKLATYSYGGRKTIDTSSYNDSYIEYYKNSLVRQTYIPIKNDVLVVVNDKFVSNAKIRKYIKENLSVNQVMIELKGATKKAVISNDIAKFMDVIGVPEDKVIHTSKLVEDGIIDITVNRTKSAAVDRSLVQQLNKYGKWERDELDFEEGGYFVKYFKSNWVTDYENPKYIRKIEDAVAFLKTVGAIEEDAIIAGFSKSHYKKYSGTEQWVDLYTLLEDTIEKNKDMIATAYANKESVNSFTYGGGYYFKTNLMQLAELVKTCDIINDIKSKINDIDEKMQVLSCLPYKEFYINPDISFEIGELIASKTVEIDMGPLWEKYPLLEYLFNKYHYTDSNIFNHMAEYVMMVSKNDQKTIELKVV